MEEVIALVGTVMVFSIPLAAIITNHFRKQTKLKGQFIQDQLQLEKLKNENYLLETEKLRLELEKMKHLEYTGEDKNKII